MKNIAVILFATSLVGCVKIPQPEPALGALTGVLIAGEPVTDICWQPVGAEPSLFPTGMHLYSGSNERKLTASGSCFFLPDPDFQPVSGDVCRISVEEGGLLRTAEVIIPPSPEGAEVTNPQFTVSTTTEHPVTNVTWNPLPGYLFALKMEPVESAPALINFSGITGGKFDKELLNLQSEPSVALFNTDFAYYGMHKLTVYSVDSDYADLFQYLPQFGGTAPGQGPGNFDFGPGFLGAVGKAEIYFEVLP